MDWFGNKNGGSFLGLKSQSFMGGSTVNSIAGDLPEFMSGVKSEDGQHSFATSILGNKVSLSDAPDIANAKYDPMEKVKVPW